MPQVSSTFAQYGDTPQSRIMTLAALRQLFPAPAGLTGQPVGLGPNGLDISVQPAGGMPVVLFLSDLEDMLPAASPSSASLSIAKRAHRAEVSSRLLPTAPTLGCGQGSRDIVPNTSGLIWNPGADILSG
jgi:hypothetical protein